MLLVLAWMLFEELGDDRRVRGWRAICGALVAAVVAMLLAAVVVGCGQDGDSGTPNPATDAGDVSSESGGSDSFAIIGIEGIEGFWPAIFTRISGTGNSVEGPFTLKPGILMMAAGSAGGNFAVTLVQGEAEELAFVESAFNEAFGYAGQLALRISEDVASREVFFDIFATCCAWEIEFSQDTSGDLLTLPLDGSGSGDVVVGPVNLEAGTYQISGSIDVQTFFAVHLWQVGGLGFQSANSAGTLDLTLEFEIRPSQAGLYILSVRHGLPGTDPLGEWQLLIR